MNNMIIKNEGDSCTESEIMVSIFCLAYNHEKYIQTALDGLINQRTDFNYEVLVHDDASTDNTVSIISDYQKAYPDIIKPIFQSQNQYSRQIRIISSYLLPKARGKYIAFCEGDDYWCDDSKLQMQVDILEGNQSYVACVHNTEFQYLSTGEKKIAYPQDDKVLGVEDCIMRGGQSYHTSSLIIRRELYENRPAFTQMVSGVGDYSNAIYYSLCGPIYYIGKVMSVYRYGTEGSWTQRVQENPEKCINYRRNVIKMLESADKYSSKNYHDSFEDAIERQEYLIYLAQHDYRKVIKSKSFMREKRFKKFKYFIYALIPGLRTIVYKVRSICKNGKRH